MSAAVAVLGVWVLEQSTTFDLGTPAGPWLMPALAGALLVVLGVVGAVSPERRIAEPWTLAVLVRLGLVAAMLIAFVVILSTEGFLLAAILLSFAFGAIARGTLRLSVRGGSDGVGNRRRVVLSVRLRLQGSTPGPRVARRKRVGVELLGVIGQAARELFTPIGLLCLVGGTFCGMFTGALPGIGPLSGISLLLPLVSLPPAEALIFYTTLYQAAEYGGSITAIAVSTPGSPNSAAMILDGYSLNRLGKAAKAFAYSLWSATFAGGVTTLLLIVLTPLVASWALLIGPREYAALGILGLTATVFLVGQAPRRGVIAVALGVLIGTVGLDPVTGVARFSFGNLLLAGGIPLAPMLIGVFASAGGGPDADRGHRAGEGDGPRGPGLASCA